MLTARQQRRTAQLKEHLGRLEETELKTVAEATSILEQVLDGRDPIVAPSHLDID